MNSFVKYLLLAEGFAVTTYGIGWWSVPIVAALWSLFSKDAHRVRNAGIAASAGWASLLLLDVWRGPVSTMADQLGALMGLPPFLLYVLTLLFPAILAWCAAIIARRPVRPLAASAHSASS